MNIIESDKYGHIQDTKIEPLYEKYGSVIAGRFLGICDRYIRSVAKANEWHRPTKTEINNNVVVLLHLLK
ncbi:TPA: hypothetical protein I7708_08680 [Vibrio vulnificus]|nr:hypothetical protein [Vibrio vulnificus]